MRVVHARRRSTCAAVADDRGRRRVASLWREAVSSSSVALANDGIWGATKTTSASPVAAGSASRRAYAKATKKETMTKNKKTTTTTTKTTTTAKKTTRKKKDESSSSTKLGKSVSSKGGAIRTDAPPKVEKVHVLPHLPVVRTIGNTPPSSPSFAATAATATSSNSSTTAAAHRTDAPPRVEKVTVLPHLPARADGGRIAPSSVTTRATVAGVGAASGKGASSSSSSSSSTSSSFEQKQQQNVNAEGLDFGTVARALAGMAIVVGGIYSVVSSPSSGHQNAKKMKMMKMKSINDESKKSREELNDKEHHEPLLIEETAETKVAVESKEDESVSAQKVKSKNEEDEERMAEDLLIQKLREDAAKLIEEEFTRAFVPDSSTSSTSTSPQPETTTTTTTQSSSSSPSLSSEDVSRPKYGEKEVAKELTEVFETASKLLTKNMDSAEAASSSQKQGQVENTDAAKLDRALDQLAHEQANVQALETKCREMEKEHAENLEKSKREYALKAEETVLAERAERVKQLDEERIKFGALKTILSDRRKTLEDARAAHEIIASISKLSEKIEKGESFAREMRLLKKVAENDDVLRALLSGTENTLERLASKDVPTLEQLRDTLEKQVKRDARRVYLIPKEGGGMLAYAVASLASLIKVEETGGMENSTSPISLEAAIAQAETLLRDDGDSVGDAARILLKASEHSKAKDVVQSWATSAMEREEIDFILRSLVAHANAKSSGV